MEYQPQPLDMAMYPAMAAKAVDWVNRYIDDDGGVHSAAMDYQSRRRGAALQDSVTEKGFDAVQGVCETAAMMYGGDDAFRGHHQLIAFAVCVAMFDEDLLAHRVAPLRKAAGIIVGLVCSQTDGRGSRTDFDKVDVH